MASGVKGVVFSGSELGFGALRCRGLGVGASGFGVLTLEGFFWERVGGRWGFLRVAQKHGHTVLGVHLSNAENLGS